MKSIYQCVFISALLLLTSCASIISATSGDDGIREDKGKRSIGSMMDDSSIETSIKVNLNAADPALKDAHIIVVSYDAIVLLAGQVPSQELKNLATRVATSSSSRVETVYNELEVAGDTTFLSRSSDTWVTAKIKTLLLADSETSGLRTKVVTSNGVVYLMGLTTHAEADKIVELVSHTGGVVKVVRAFEYID